MTNIKFKLWDSTCGDFLIYNGDSVINLRDCLRQGALITENDSIEIPLKDFEIVEYTNKKDVNDEEIYLHDILQYKKEKVVVVLEDAKYMVRNLKTGRLMGNLSDINESSILLGSSYMYREILNFLSKD